MDRKDFEINDSPTCGEIAKVFIIILVCVYAFMFVAGSFIMQ